MSAQTCPQCGSQITGTPLCPQCGAPMRPSLADGAATRFSSPGNRRFLLIGGIVGLVVLCVFVAVNVGLLAIVLQQQRNADKGGEVSSAGITLRRPPGWAQRENEGVGLVLALRQEDLDAETPRGARLQVQLAAGAAPDVGILLTNLVPPGADAATAAGRIVLAADPFSVPVGPAKGVGIRLREERSGRALTSEYVVVNVDGGRVYQFVLEAPTEYWNDLGGTLDAILVSARFERP